MEFDASSRFQDSLPVSSDQLLRQLQLWAIDYKCHYHVPVGTVQQSKLIQHRFSQVGGRSGHIKNLYLRDKKKNNFLVTVQQDREINLKELKDIIGAGRLSFGSPERLMENLGVYPGAVTPFCMINGVKTGVRFFLDNSLRLCSKIYAHPLVNDRTLEVSLRDLEKFFDRIGAQINWIRA
ncbi:MAG: aminoacyl-tRNA deacylase [Rhodospirillaceae bacterium]|nr:aminoacyl-tRNA deacylase [Rhodospirillaceae bacterium]|tara:strand:- start:3056 stop:3595 length:540 start_codon:yes stop_codon:yes gene_type:complete